ncbi:MAG: ABC transporter ATP-binding protein [Coriobacteriales bacterium]|nr:ABC transporter ATP-binding protein [Coriobacteriales bacterium]
MEKTCLIKTENLTKTFGKNKGLHYAVKNVSIEIYEGEFLVILGHSACGKSTLLNCISGMDRATSGHIYYKGEDITKLSDRKLTFYRRDKIAFVFQFFNLLYDLTSIGNSVLAPGSNKNYDEIKKLFADIGLENKEFEYPKNLSGGQQQRVAIARALNKKSEVLICDEPTGALDEESGRAVLSLLEKINQRDKKTVVLVTHTAEIAKMADRVIFLKNGEVADITINSHKITAAEVEY